jgi:hypothetical protein
LITGVLADLSNPALLYDTPFTIAVDINFNSKLVVREQYVVKEEVDTDRDQVKRLARALDVVDDLGVWAEWLGQEVQKEGKSAYEVILRMHAPFYVD